MVCCGIILGKAAHLEDKENSRNHEENHLILFFSLDLAWTVMFSIS